MRRVQISRQVMLCASVMKKCLPHLRFVNIEEKLNTEEKGKVVAAVWGYKIYSIPCHSSYFALGRFKE